MTEEEVTEEDVEYKLVWQEVENGPWSQARGNGFSFSGSGVPILNFSGSHGIIILPPTVKYVIKKIISK